MDRKARAPQQALDGLKGLLAGTSPSTEHATTERLVAEVLCDGGNPGRSLRG
jgi:hypothetical protein